MSYYDLVFQMVPLDSDRLNEEADQLPSQFLLGEKVGGRPPALSRGLWA